MISCQTQAFNLFFYIEVKGHYSGSFVQRQKRIAIYHVKKFVKDSQFWKQTLSILPDFLENWHFISHFVWRSTKTLELLRFFDYLSTYTQSIYVLLFSSKLPFWFKSNLNFSWVFLNSKRMDATNVCVQRYNLFSLICACMEIFIEVIKVQQNKETCKNLTYIKIL